jgi:hypothetical protein
MINYLSQSRSPRFTLSKKPDKVLFEYLYHTLVQDAVLNRIVAPTLRPSTMLLMTALHQNLKVGGGLQRRSVYKKFCGNRSMVQKFCEVTQKQMGDSMTKTYTYCLQKRTLGKKQAGL